ncbi:MAG: hypothetical protein RQ760_11775 [Sedimentisphaerales bacterium]|nr:hypothetical protein [Sedimentisphaerales bacterium]
MKKLLLGWVFILLYCQSLGAQPAPGDLFREYRWFYEKGDAGQAIRVGGKQGESYPDRGSEHGYINAAMKLPHDLDLAEAVKAEIVIEKILCHDGTTGLAIQINNSDWYYFPEASDIPAPQARYQHHIYPVIRVPVSVFKSGPNNSFRLRVDPEHPWRWSQNLINGLHIRIYYDPEKKSHPIGEIKSPQSGDTVKLSVEYNSANCPIKQVDYVGLYEDVNYEGDGVYRQWHYNYFHSRLVNHIGSVVKAPFDFVWDTSWVPDQKEPLQIAARITDQTGLTYQTPAITNLSLKRTIQSVELCKPYDIPQKWVTRSGEKSEYFDVGSDLNSAVAAQLVWSSWSPGYMNGILINGVKVFDQEGPRYQSYFHRVTLTDLSMFQSGRNVLTTGKTPKYNGKMVHGMEVNWPGIMVLIQYNKR